MFKVIKSESFVKENKKSALPKKAKVLFKVIKAEKSHENQEIANSEHKKVLSNTIHLNNDFSANKNLKINSSLTKISPSNEQLKQNLSNYSLHTNKDYSNINQLTNSSEKLDYKNLSKVNESNLDSTNKHDLSKSDIKNNVKLSSSIRKRNKFRLINSNINKFPFSRKFSARKILRDENKVRNIKYDKFNIYQKVFAIFLLKSNKFSYYSLSKKLGVSKNTLRNWDVNGIYHVKHSGRRVASLEFEKMLLSWINNRIVKGEKTSRLDIIKFMAEYKPKNLKLTSGWYYKFKKRNNII